MRISATAVLRVDLPGTSRSEAVVEDGENAQAVEDLWLLIGVVASLSRKRSRVQVPSLAPF